MIDFEVSRKLQPALCTAISSLLQDDILEVLGSGLLIKSDLGEKIEWIGRDIAALGRAVAVMPPDAD